MYLAFLSLALTYISPSFYLFIMYALRNQMGFPHCELAAKIVTIVYVLVFFSAIAGSFKGKSWVQHAHIISVILAIFNLGLTALGIFNILIIYFTVIENPFTEGPTLSVEDYASDFRFLSISIIGGIIFGSFIFILFIHIPTHLKFVCKLIINTPSYIAYTGAYSQTMVIHSFCNIDDVSWGTKGSKSSGVNRFMADKVFFVTTWLLTNAIISYVLLYIDLIDKASNSEIRGGLTLLILSIVAVSQILIKSLLSIYHQLKWLFFERCCY